MNENVMPWQYKAQARIRKVLKKELGLNCVVRIFNKEFSNKVEYWILDIENRRKIMGEFKYNFGKDPYWVFEDKILRKARLSDWDKPIIRQTNLLEGSFIEAIKRIGEAKGFVVAIVPWMNGYSVSVDDKSYFAANIEELEDLVRKGGR